MSICREMGYVRCAYSINEFNEEKEFKTAPA
jgi:hypothetical protein